MVVECVPLIGSAFALAPISSVFFPGFTAVPFITRAAAAGFPNRVSLFACAAAKGETPVGGGAPVHAGGAFRSSYV